MNYNENWRSIEKEFDKGKKYCDKLSKTIEGFTINNASDMSMFLLENALVATVTGDAFGDPNCIRISYAASKEQLVEAVTRIKKKLN